MSDQPVTAAEIEERATELVAETVADIRRKRRADRVARARALLDALARKIGARRA
jgi:hypothetical protein